ncbi:50S ribosomal protein L33 [Mycoplasmoides pneumoniae]|uniref:Large ribosomal subunit protein bL33B n=2 Tax=Mycoplasmoides pneumoniae TaxID=2104 RepID=RL332_MYCPN|nr:50S ribosomal protein L33 [Mycoplasmoides pneumoniae]P56850.1 RecName: Full=Large ribosomal subunit protein bL33B; AltName: Full=50S ribosomal protein L33 2 [Mycoplasmoides pneumoniae M129]AAG34736.1 ribosomal protein L33 type2 [Mycoplasmoides pneumoniae M129]AGC04010.1 50S ribosomal protein L33 [Mycoplasmoides pneumoniae M129-B7]ALA30553.1 50S ribosomal protein L33 [Mycoplasmoides pneumoniae PI 1428]ALA31261.1 50S ribosomal protein L33 [Mycoplasmoides pneumoniae 19294]ALA31953.1 50S ribos
MRKKIIFVCQDCLSRNYVMSWSKQVLNRLIINKYCKHCNQKTKHLDSF